MPHWRRAASILVLGALFACVGGEKGAVEPTTSLDDALAVVTVTPNAAILAVGETRQLTINATTLTRVPITDFDTVLYIHATGADTARINISPTGLVTAKQPGALLRVNVIVKRHRQFGGAQAILQVTPTAIAGATLSIQPTDSTRLAAGSIKTLPATVRNASTGESVPNPVVRYTVRSEDSHRAILHKPTIFYGGMYHQISTNIKPAFNQIAALTPESSVWIYGTVDAYGTVLRDSVLFTFTHPFSMTVPVLKSAGAIISAFDARTLTLAPGATVTFRSSVRPTTDPLRIAYTFDNPAAATVATPAATVGGSTGNVSPLAPSQQSARRFMTPGTYKWTATATGGPAPWPGQTLSGTIVIK